MATVFYLLSVFAILGAIDVGYFHLHRFRLYRVPSSRAEQVTHLVRTGLFVAAMTWVMCVDAHGAWSLVLPAILLADFLNSMTDVILEPTSRLPLGGLPPMEYALHMVSMAVSGALMAVVVIDAQARWSAPSAVRYHLLTVPPPALMIGWQVLLIASGLCIFEAVNFFRSLGRP